MFEINIIFQFHLFLFLLLNWNEMERPQEDCAQRGKKKSIPKGYSLQITFAQLSKWQNYRDGEQIVYWLPGDRRNATKGIRGKKVLGMSQTFSGDEQLCTLTVVVTWINTWNKLHRTTHIHVNAGLQTVKREISL